MSVVRPSPVVALEFVRLPLRELGDRPGLLGARVLGAAGGAESALHATLLAPSEPIADAWFTPDEAVNGQRGCIRYATDGQWLHGSAEIDELSEGGLQAGAARAYHELFALLLEQRCPHLLRLWNYMADINAAQGGLERYRQFNIGRQQAFISARRSAFEGAPAACAVGTQRGPLQVWFLAGPAAPLAIENPRQVSAYRYPPEYGPRSPTFSRAALARLDGRAPALFISGTASIVGHASVHAGNVRRQTEECLANIAAVLDAAATLAGTRFAAAELIYTIYLRHRDDLAAVLEVFERQLGRDSPAARSLVVMLADICRAELLVEIEAQGGGATARAA